jgi:hypothetical protein
MRILDNKWQRKRAALNALTVTVFCVSLFLMALPAQAAQGFADSAFQRLWNRTDKLVADGKVSRTFLWGPEPSSGAISEDYAEAPGGKRLVQYFDKSRMEITNPGSDQNSAYYVTNGLIAKELISGQLQLGDNKFDQRTPAEVGVAGDPDDTNGPTYKSLNGLTGSTANKVGGAVTTTLSRDGQTSDGSADYGKYNVTLKFFAPETGHNIAAPFWDFLNQTGPVLNTGGQQTNGRIFDPVFFATGLPITEPYWAKVKVANQVKDVLVQAFERRVLTYTPSNSAAFQVEMGNVGQHYYKWRYGGTTPPTGNPNPTPPPPPGTPAPAGNIPAAGCLPAISTSGSTVQSCVSNEKPTANSSVTVYGRLIVEGKLITGVKMETTWHYRDNNQSCSADPNSNGVASCTLGIGSPLKGYKVIIEVHFMYDGGDYVDITSFIPQ